MTQAEIIDLTKIAQSFPAIPEPEISRENILETIDTLFDTGNQIAIVEGRDGIGKTNILSQFVRKYPDNAFSIFITANCIWGYDPYIIKQDLFDQIRVAIDFNNIGESEPVSDSNFGTCIYNLRKKAKIENQIFYFVIDGLSDIPKDREDVQQEILKWLPLSFRKFRFLLSGDLSEKITGNSLKDLKVKSCPLPGFSLGETVQYFRDSESAPADIEEIHKVCKGIPGYIESIRRIIKDGKNVQTLLDEMPDHLPNLFKLEWEKVKDNEDQLILLAIIAYGRWQNTVKDLSEILSTDFELVNETIESLPFISIEGKNHHVTFVSDVFRKFAISQLKGFKNRASEILIDSLLNKGDSYLSYKYLPILYQELGKSDDLLNYLSSEQADKLVDHFKSILPLQQKALMGVTTALKLNRADDLVKFSMQSSALKSLWETKILHSEIEALMALDKYDKAIALANSNVIYEEKLQLLCLIAKSKSEQGLSADEDLIEQIKELYAKINIEVLGDEAIEIASNLIYSVPELAIDLVEKTTNNSSKTKGADWGFRKLSFAVLNDSSTKKIKFDAIENIKRNVTDPNLKNFSTGLALLLGEYSSQKVISESQKMQGPEEQLSLLRAWTKENLHKDDALEVIEHALTLILKSTRLSPTARVLSELSMPLPNMKNAIKIKLLVGRFDTFIDTAKKLGPTKDYVNLQLILADAESKYDFVNAGSRIKEVYSYVGEINDILLKTECLIGIMVALKKIDNLMVIDNEYKIHSLIQKELDPQIENLLKNTADHYETSKDIINSLTKSDPDRAIALAENLNTEDRRDHALFEFINSALERPESKINLDSIKKALSKIQDKEVIDLSIGEIIERFAKFDNNQLNRSLLPLINEAQKISNSINKCKTLSYSYILLKNDVTGKFESLSERVLKVLRISWESIDIEWEQIDTGFKIVKTLASSSMELSQQFLSKIEEKRKSIIIDSGAVAVSYINFVRLAIRSLSGLMAKNLVSSDDIEELRDLIEQIASRVVRSNLWSRLAIRYYINGDKNNCEKIIIEHVKPLLQKLLKENSDDKIHAIIDCAPSLHCAHKNSAFEMIEYLPPFEKDYAYYKICEFIIRNHPLSDPFDNSTNSMTPISYEKLLDLCEIINRMKHDSLIYGIIDSISDNIKTRKKWKVLSEDQLKDISKKIIDVITSKFPNPNYIQHDGYKIISKAQILSINKGSKEGDWKNLIQEALKIPNLADKSHVLLIISVLRPSKYNADRQTLIQQCIEIANSIPSSVEKIEHFEGIASKIMDIESTLGKECLKVAMEESLRSDNHEYATAQQKLVDIAYRYDHDFANSLASLADEDPGRIMARTNINKRLNRLELKKKLIEASKEVTLESDRVRDYPNAAWMRLGSLNSNRIESVHINDTYRLSEIAAFLPITDAYPIFSYTIENAIKRYSKTDQAGTYFRPMYKAASTAAILSLKLAQKSLKHREIPLACTIRKCGSDNIIIRSGEREKAELFIQNWFEKNVKTYLKICDPYFGPDELDLIKLFSSINPNAEIFVLTSKKHQNQESIKGSLEEYYRKKWKQDISDNDPIYTDFVIVGTKGSGDLPIHDRWWLTDNGGLRFGSSYNGIGLKKDSEISILNHQESVKFESEIDKYLNNSKREHQGERLLYTRFNL